MTTILTIAQNSNAVSKVAAWNDRYYVNLEAPASGCNGDRNTKIWVKGDTLTIQGGKGYRSDEFNAALTALEAEIVAAGGVRKGYSDSIDATYTLAV